MWVLKAGFNFWSWNFLCSQNGFIAISLFALQVDDFLQALINYDKEHIPENCLKVVKEQYLKDPEFNPSLIRTKSFAAAGLCAWVINIVKFYEVSVLLHWGTAVTHKDHQDTNFYGGKKKENRVKFNYLDKMKFSEWDLKMSD